MHIVIVEDDFRQAAWMNERIKGRWPAANVERLNTELDFREALPRLAAHPPSLIILDVMLRWQDLSPTMVARPDDVKAEGVYRAGLRCERLLAQDERTRDVPVILYTTLDAPDMQGPLKVLPCNVRYVRKDTEARELLEAICEFVVRQR